MREFYLTMEAYIFSEGLAFSELEALQLTGVATHN
jgi:hypothetical protein